MSSAPNTHCPYRQAVQLQQALASDKMRVGFFLGAGCPVSIKVPSGAGGGITQPLIPDIEGLTNQIRVKLSGSVLHKGHFNTILTLLDDSPTSKATVETILTRVRGLADVVGTTTFEGMSKADLTGLDRTLCEEISAVMMERLPSRDTPYHQLASWIGSIPRTHPVELFTSNYDLLLEQALEESAVPYFDGFSGSDRTFFDVPSMEQHEKLPPRWARLWKVHGSINWWINKDNEVQRRQKGDKDAALMIHPTHLKYDQSRVMPYIAMQDRLRAFLNHGQAVLVTCGYSFVDWHLNQAILQGLSGNPSAVCFGLIFGERSRAKSEIAKVGSRGNLRLLGIDGGVLGTVDHDWHAKPVDSHEFHESVVVTGSLGTRTNAPEDRCKFTLGDFKALGEFLAVQLVRKGDGDSIGT
jgi:hypothetical protein